MEQILLNLVANAKEAMPDGGAVAISTANLGLADQNTIPPQTGVDRNAAYVRLRVKDTGTGIAPETLLRVFEPYFSTKESTGLGLSTVEAIVRRQGGQVQVTSRVDRGTVFDVLLPRSDHPVRPAVSQVISRRPRSISPLVLVAARDQDRCLELTTALACLNLRSLAATSVSAAMELARQHATRLGALVTDAELGDVRELAELCPKAVWVLIADPSGTPALAGAGCAVVLGRPLAPGALAEALRSLRSDPGAD
jgi:hypothetical protein